MLMEFSLDVNNCRTNWMRKQAGLLKYADGNEADPPKEGNPATPAAPSEEQAAWLAEQVYADKEGPKSKAIADLYKKTYDDSSNAGMFNTTTGSLGGLGIGSLIALSRPKDKRDWKTWLASLGIGGGLGFVGGGMSETYNRTKAGLDAVVAQRAKDIEAYQAANPNWLEAYTKAKAPKTAPEAGGDTGAGGGDTGAGGGDTGAGGGGDKGTAPK